jgi:hypothetical protein
MSIFLTIISGFTVFVLGQVFLKLIIEPVQELKKTISNVRFNVIKSAHITFNSNSVDAESLKEVFNEFRSLSADLHAKVYLVPLYDFWRIIFFLPSRKNIGAASTNLIAISNWINISDHKQQLGYILKNSQDLHDNLDMLLEEKDRISEETLRELVRYA